MVYNSFHSIHQFSTIDLYEERFVIINMFLGKIYPGGEDQIAAVIDRDDLKGQWKSEIELRILLFEKWIIAKC